MQQKPYPLRSADAITTAMEAWKERHYSVGELAEMWGLDPSTVRTWFADELGVLKHGHSGIRSKKRPYMTLRIPESVARRVHAERSKGWAESEVERKRATIDGSPGGKVRQRNSA